MIHAKNLSKYYGERIALDNVSFDIVKGECVGFLGRNGAGKSTTLKILATALIPSAGTVRVGDYDLVAQPDDVRRLLGFLPEEPPLYPEMPVYAYLKFLGELRGLGGSKLDGRIREVAEQTSLVDVLFDPILTLSLGFRKRVGIAQAILHDPQLVIVDEPISGLDPYQIREIRELIRSLRGRHTILLSSHILTELSQTCDRFLVIEKGRIVAHGTEDELLRTSGGGSTVTVEVRGTRDAVVAALKGVATVSGSHVVSEAHGIVTVEVSLKSDSVEDVSSAVVKAGLGLRSIASHAGTLESIFLELTGRKAA